MAVSTKDEMVLDRSHETVPAFSDVCNFCRHYRGQRTCAAYPEGIPLPIWLEENNHRAPYPGDNGILFALFENPEQTLVAA